VDGKQTVKSASIRLYTYAERVGLLKMAGFSKVRGVHPTTDAEFQLGANKLFLIADEKEVRRANQSASFTFQVHALRNCMAKRLAFGYPPRARAISRSEATGHNLCLLRIKEATSGRLTQVGRGENIAQAYPGIPPYPGFVARLCFVRPRLGVGR
jgi:hypothetical protein